MTWLHSLLCSCGSAECYSLSCPAIARLHSRSKEISGIEYCCALMARLCAQEDVPEALRKKAEPASTQGSALPSRAVSQDASLATGPATAAAAAADGAQPEVASPPATVVPELIAAAAAEGDTAAQARSDALPAPQSALEAGQAAEPMQIDAPAVEGAAEQGLAAAAAEDTAAQATADQPQAGDAAAEKMLDAKDKALQGADMTAPSKGNLSLDRQLLGTRSRSDPLDSSKGAPLVSKEVPSVSAPNGNGTSLHEGGASLQEAEQPNGEASPHPRVQEAVQPDIKPSKAATIEAAPLENGVPDKGEAAAPAKQSKPATKRTRRS